MFAYKTFALNVPKFMYQFQESGNFELAAFISRWKEFENVMMVQWIEFYCLIQYTMGARRSSFFPQRATF